MCSSDLTEPIQVEVEQKYDIERIVRAERVGKGWRLHVKWVGYGDDHVTPEPLSRILADTKDPSILDQIARCKEEYLAAHPNERHASRAEDTLPAPTRSHPERAREKPY